MGIIRQRIASDNIRVRSEGKNCRPKGGVHTSIVYGKSVADERHGLNLDDLYISPFIEVAYAESAIH